MWQLNDNIGEHARTHIRTHAHLHAHPLCFLFQKGAEAKQTLKMHTFFWFIGQITRKTDLEILFYLFIFFFQKLIFN